MRIEFPQDVDEINSTDFDILRCLYIDGPLWKMEICRKLNGRRADGNMLLDLKESISKQAVSRRVERLHELGYVESAIIDIDSRTDLEPPRGKSYILGYDNSSKGQDAMELVVRKIFRDVIGKVIEDDVVADDFVYLEFYEGLFGKLSGEGSGFRLKKYLSSRM